jgi:anaerobic magnesium-protoporphyrin IX monomethyl ester cyclase
MKKVIFTLIGSNKAGMKPPAASILTAVMRRAGHEVIYFDTTFMNTGRDLHTAEHKALKAFKKVDYSRYRLDQADQIDARREFLRLVKEEMPDVIAATCVTDMFQITLEFLRLAKEQRNIPTVVGGIHATLNPDEVIAEEAVDAVCIGEGEEALLEFLDAVEGSRITHTDIRNLWIKQDGRIHKNPIRPLTDLDSLPFMDYSIFDPRHFHRPFMGRMYVGGDVQEKRGCPRRCSYCANARLNEIYENSRVNRYSPERFVEEMVFLQKTWGINFCKFYSEDIANVRTDILARISELYRERVNIPFTAGAHPQSLTPEKVRLLKNMNCVSISIALECGNEHYRSHVLKRSYSNRLLNEKLLLLQDAGIRIHLLTMIGLPFESRKMIFETIESARKTHADHVDCACYFPYRGTPLGDLSLNQGFITHEKLNDPDTVFRIATSQLRMPQIDHEEVGAIRRMWNYYIYGPRWMFPLARLCEKSRTIEEVLTPFMDNALEVHRALDSRLIRFGLKKPPRAEV